MYVTAIHTVGTLLFEETAYNIEENANSLEIMVTLSNPSSTNITVEIESTSDTATGK